MNWDCFDPTREGVCEDNEFTKACRSFLVVMGFSHVKNVGIDNIKGVAANSWA